MTEQGEHMTENASSRTPLSTAAAPPGEYSHETIHYLCRLLSVLAWIAIFLWILAPKGSRWASAAGDSGLAWILFTGGGYFAEQTVRSWVDLWKAFLTSVDQDMTCKNKEQSPR